MTRRRVSIHIERLLDVHERPEPAFFVDWCCRLCRVCGHALDRSAALDDFAEHLRTDHHASGGRIRRKK